MAARYSRFFRLVHVFGDALLLNLSFYIVNSIYYNDLRVSFTEHYIKQFLYINLFWGVSASINKVYDQSRVTRTEKVLVTLLRTFLLHVLLCFSFIVFFKEHVISYRLFSAKYLSFVVLTTFWRLGFIAVLQFLRRQGLNFRNVIIVGTGPIAVEAQNFFMNHPAHGYRFLGFFKSKTDLNLQPQGNMDVHELSEVKTFAKEKNVDEIYCSMPEVDPETVRDLMRFSDDNFIRFKLLPDFRGFIGKRLEVNFYDRIPVFMIRKEPLDNIVNRIIKRAFDLVFSFFVILLIFPWLLPIVAIAIKVSSPGPIFYRQLRTGIDNKHFYCFKFRSMQTAGSEKFVQAKKDDPRVTIVGKFLRKTSIDEIPQFINVLLGDMSVVGPRPHPIELNEKYSKIISNFNVRHFVKPGITGAAQVKGYRGETADPVLMEKRVQHDIWYIENWSLLLDNKLILLTVFKILKGDKNAV